MKQTLLFLLAFFLLHGAVEHAVQACPSCKDALAAARNPNATPLDTDQDEAGSAFSYSVLFMLAMPFTLLLGFGGAFWLMCRPKAEPVLLPTAATARFEPRPT